MCASCGCGIPEDDHGDPRNIVFSELTAAAKAQGIAENDVVNNMHAMVHQSHKVDQKPDPEPIKDAKMKGLSGDLVKDWAEWDAERAAEAAGLGRGFGRALKSRITGKNGRWATHPHEWSDVSPKMGKGSGIHETLKAAGFHPRGAASRIDGGRHYQHNNGTHALTHGGGSRDSKGNIPEEGVSFKNPGSETVSMNSNDHSLMDVAVAAQKAAAAAKSKKATSLDKAMKSLLKGAQRIETGQFTGKNDNTHSHRMKDEIVTHSHDGDKGHTHPARDYGPSFNHR